MSSQPNPVHRFRQALSPAWRALVAGLDAANRMTHHALGWLFIALVVLYFVFCGAFLSLRYLILPNIDRYKPDVESVASHLLQRPVTINAIYANWSGLNPRLRLDNLIIYNQQGERALVLPEVVATVSWWSAFTWQLQLDHLEISRPDLEIERDSEGRLFVGGIYLDTSKKDDGRGLEWLLAQREIVIRDGWVRWQDHLRDAPDLVLSKVSFVLQNQWYTHRAALHATPPEALASPIDVRAEFVHPAFGRSSDPSQWVGEIYADWGNTHLDAWSPYVTWPYKLSGGKGAIRAWLRFDRRVAVNFTADLDLRDLSIQLGDDLEPLKLVEVSGRVSAGEVATGLKEKLLSFGTQGHAVTLSKFALRTDQGEVLPSTTAKHLYTVSRNGRDEHHELQITELDLEALARLAAHLPLKQSERGLLNDFAPRGQLNDFVASWDGAIPGEGKYRLSGRFSQLALKRQAAVVSADGRTLSDALPGFDGLSGQIDASQDGGSAKLSGSNVTFYVEDLLNTPALSFEELEADTRWSLKDKNHLLMNVASMHFSQSGLKGSLEGSHRLPRPLRKDTLGEIDMHLHVPALELTRVAGFLPAGIPQGTRDWVSGALVDGTGRDLQLTIKGNLDKFPFKPQRPGDKPPGVFKISARLDHAKLNPAPQELASDKRTPLWHRIDDIQGVLTLDQTRLHVHADSARTAGVQLAGVDAVIPDYLSSRPVLDVSGAASGQLQAMLNYVNNTPVGGWIDNFTDEARGSGNARLSLKMQIPLSDATQSVAQGAVRFQGNEVQLWRSVPGVQNVSGEIAFSERGVQLNGVQGGFLGGPIVLSGGTQKDGSTQVKAEGAVSVDGVTRGLNTAPMRRLAKKMSGSTRYSALVRVRGQGPEITVDSTLAGLSLDFPAPLGKSQSETMPLRFGLSPLVSADPTMQQEEIRINLGRSVSARYLRQRVNARSAPWKLVRGGIGVNLPAPQPDTGIALNLSMPVLNVDAWRAAVTALSADSGGSSESGGAGSGQDIGSFFSPDSIGVRTAQLIVAERSLENAVLGASRQRNGWQFNIHSDQAIGHAIWDDPWFERGAGKFTAHFTSLVIPKSESSDMTELLSGKKTSKELPGLDIVADDFELRGMRLGRLELAATNAIGPGREWRISRLVITNPEAILRATGKWLVSSSDSQSSMSYELDINDAGKLLDRVGFEKTLRGGKGRIDGEINWKGSPTSFDFPSLSGNLSLKLGSGQFLKADPGVAKLLGVMSLQSLPRRLTLDFRDIFSEGFQFDSIASTATIARGVLKTDSFKMRGVNAVVLMDGTVDLNEETQNLSVIVIPELNAGGASVVYGLAVNPVIGLGSFLAQLFLRNPLSQALTQEYQITGPWKDPVIKKAATRRKLPPADNDKNAQ